MKKLMLLAALFAIVNFASAQQSPSAAPAKKEVKARSASEITTTSAAAKMKKDGTPDMRYKTNKKEAAKAAGPKKKDGTPDMRYKANKSTSTKKKEGAPAAVSSKSK